MCGILWIIGERIGILNAVTLTWVISKLWKLGLQPIAFSIYLVLSRSWHMCAYAIISATPPNQPVKI